MKSRYKKVVFAGGSMMDEHRFLMERHLGRKLTADEVVHHVNGNPRDNRIENLQVMTRREHAQHHLKGKPGHPCPPHAKAALSRRHGGLNHRCAKITPDDATAILHRRSAGESYASIAKDFPVDRTQIVRVCTGQHWTTRNKQPSAMAA